MHLAAAVTPSPVHEIVRRYQADFQKLGVERIDSTFAPDSLLLQFGERGADQFLAASAMLRDTVDGVRLVLQPFSPAAEPPGGVGVHAVRDAVSQLAGVQKAEVVYGAGMEPTLLSVAVDGPDRATQLQALLRPTLADGSQVLIAGASTT